jgi:hypothetical protein
MSYGAKGVPARFISVGPTTAAKGDVFAFAPTASSIQRFTFHIVNTPGPTCQGLSSLVTCLPYTIKGMALASQREGRNTFRPMTFSLSSNTAHSGYRVLCSYGLNHSKLLCSSVHLLRQAKLKTLLIRGP